MDSIETKVLEHIDSLSIAEPSLDDSFSNLGMNSLDEAELVEFIEKDFKIAIPDKEFFAMKNGRDIVSYIRQYSGIEKKYQISPDLRDKLVKYLSTIEELADELTTANVSHKKSYIKGVARRAQEYLIKHT